MAILKFGKISIYHIYCLIIPFILSVDYAVSFIPINKKKEGGESSQLVFANAIIMAFGTLFAGLVQKFRRYKDKDKNKNKEKEEEESTQINSEDYKKLSFFTAPKKKKIKTYKFLFIILSSMIDIFVKIASAIVAITEIETEICDLLHGIQIIFIWILCYFVFKNQCFIHRILGTVILIIGILIICLVDISYAENNNLLRLTICFSIVAFLLAIEEVLDKWTMETFSIFPSDIMLFKGIFDIIFGFTAYIIFKYISCPNESFIFVKYCTDGKMFNSFNIKNFYYFRLGIYCFLYIAIMLVYNFLFYNVIFFLSPTHVTIADWIKMFFLWFINFLTKKESKFWTNTCPKVIMPIGIIISLIGCCIFNEIIILKFWGLDKNVRESIIKRGTIEAEENENENKNLEKFEDSFSEEDSSQKNENSF